MDIRHGFLAGLVLSVAACGGSGSPVTQSVPQAVPPPVQAAPPPPLATEHLITYGQSLSLGERAVIDFTGGNLGVPADDNENVGLMFVGGTRPEDLSSLVPFLESTELVDAPAWGGIATPGETPLYGALLTVKDMDTALHIGSAAGAGGTPIVGLIKGTPPYARLIEQVTQAKALSPGAYSVMGIIWMQGESDLGNTNYAAEFSQLVMDLDTDIRAITGQGPVQIYVCETLEWGIGEQQVAVAAAMPQVHIACNDGDFPKSDGTHLTAAGSKAVGVAIGAAILAR